MQIQYFTFKSKNLNHNLYVPNFVQKKKSMTQFKESCTHTDINLGIPSNQHLDQYRNHISI